MGQWRRYLGASNGGEGGAFLLVSLIVVAASLGWGGIGVMEARATTFVVVAVVFVDIACGSGVG